MAKLRDRPDNLFALVGATAAARGLPAEFVEKDYWVTELLRSVAAPIDDAFVVFKGGTSLSKGYGLIQRFSEDVDLLVVVTNDQLGRGGRDRILKSLCARSRTDLGLDEASMVPVNSSTGVHRGARYVHPSRFAATVVQPGVLLEAGVRGGPEPREPRTFRSLVADHAIGTAVAAEGEFDEFAPVTIPVLQPRRTLIEKLDILHDRASRLPETRDALAKAARHLYDVSRLLADAGVRGSLGGSSEFARTTAADAYRVSVENEFPSTPRPDAGYASSPAFAEGHESQEILRRGLEGIRGLIVGGAPPTLEECRAAILGAAELL